MNVGGVPWTGQDNPKLRDGFRNVMILCVVMLFIVLLCFIFPSLYFRLTTSPKRSVVKKSWSINKRSFHMRSLGAQERRGYLSI